MTEVEPREDGIDSLLRRSLAARVPSLSPEFDRRLMREIHQPSPERRRYRSIMLAGYGLTSALTCTVIMRGEGLHWGLIAVMMLASVTLVAVISKTFPARRMV
jgi:hypothetical protein